MTRPTPETLAHTARAGPREPPTRTVAVDPGPPRAQRPPRPPRRVRPRRRRPRGLRRPRSLVRSLEEVGVDVVFGIPGGAILPAYDPLYDSAKVRHVLVRHEQGAGHAANGYAQATGQVGVCMATCGPGATNLVTPIADAYMDSVPIVAITGQVPAPSIGTDAFQEADISGITLPITKHNFLVSRRRGHPADHRRGVPPRLDRPPGPGAGRHPQGRAAGADHVPLAADAGPARLPADAPAARQADPRGRQADHRGPAARCSTSAAACSRPAPPPSCGSSPS